MPSQPSNLPAMIRLDLTNATSGGVLRSYGLLLCMAVVFGLFGGPQMVTTMLGLAAYVFSTTLTQYDEAFKLTNLYGSLPTSRRSVIASHYLVSSLVLLVTGLLSVAAHVGLAAFRADASGLADSLAATGATLVAIALLLALQWPLTLKFGVRRVTIYAMLLVFGTLGVVFGLSRVVDLSGVLPALATQPPWLLIGVAVAAVASAITVSYRVSQRIYAAQDH